MGLKGEPPKASSFVSIKERLDASRMPFDPYALRASLSAENWKEQPIAFPPHANRNPFIPADAVTDIGSHSSGLKPRQFRSVAEFSPEVRFWPQFPRLSGRWRVAGVKWPLLVTLKTTLTAWCNQREQFLGLGQNPPADPITRTAEAIC
jgi:hypothetical protein